MATLTLVQGHMSTIESTQISQLVLTWATCQTRNGQWAYRTTEQRQAKLGMARQQDTNELAVATAMVGVDMRLAPNAYRELHWHSVN